MQPQDPNNQAYAPQPAQPVYAQPAAPQPVPAQPAAPQYAQPQQPQQYGYPQPAGAPPLGMISAIVGGVSVLAFGILFGFVFGGSSYWLLLISLAIAAPGVFLGFKTLNEGGSLNKLALAGFVLSLIGISLSFSFTAGLAVAEHKAKSAASSYTSGY